MENNNKNPGNTWSNGGIEDAELKFGKMYHVIDALIDTINLPQNRKNAVKFGIRAIGELLSEFPHDQQQLQQAREAHEQKVTSNGKSEANSPVSAS